MFRSFHGNTRKKEEEAKKLNVGLIFLCILWIFRKIPSFFSGSNIMDICFIISTKMLCI